MALVSHWGKMAQRSDLSQTSIIKSRKDLLDLLSSPDKVTSDIVLVSDETIYAQWKYKEEAEVSTAYTNVVLASYTTAQARIVLYEYLEKLNKRVLYFDTDSCIYVSTSNEDEYEPPLGSALGAMTDELAEYGKDTYIRSFVSGGPKFYAYEAYTPGTNDINYCCKIKGISLNYENSKKINYDSVKQMILKLYDDDDDDDDDGDNSITVNFRSIRRTKTHEVTELLQEMSRTTTRTPTRWITRRCESSQDLCLYLKLSTPFLKIIDTLHRSRQFDQHLLYYPATNSYTSIATSVYRHSSAIRRLLFCASLREEITADEEAANGPDDASPPTYESLFRPQFSENTISAANSVREAEKPSGSISKPVALEESEMQDKSPIEVIPTPTSPGAKASSPEIEKLPIESIHPSNIGPEEVQTPASSESEASSNSMKRPTSINGELQSPASPEPEASSSSMTLYGYYEERCRAAIVERMASDEEMSACMRYIHVIFLKELKAYGMDYLLYHVKGLHKTEKSNNKISKILGVSRCTVDYNVKKFKETDSIVNRRGKTRKKTSEAEDKFICNVSLRDRKLTAPDIAANQPSSQILSTLISLLHMFYVLMEPFSLLVAKISSFLGTDLYRACGAPLIALALRRHESAVCTCVCERRMEILGPLRASSETSLRALPFAYTKSLRHSRKLMRSCAERIVDRRHVSMAGVTSLATRSSDRRRVSSITCTCSHCCCSRCHLETPTSSAVVTPMRDRASAATVFSVPGKNSNTAKEPAIDLNYSKCHTDQTPTEPALPERQRSNNPSYTPLKVLYPRHASIHQIVYPNCLI
ncbi:unnamed protein product [Trichogramma brassicae]|uniref:Uncharacterized protein n=1 Tax=Trichogramma brassicae TaxID=86971 RepID=A0A6H5ITA4_9HYME|nr:unnamed protein product [Trichogramma brassicae]